MLLFSIYFAAVFPANSQVYTKAPLFPCSSLNFGFPVECQLRLHQLHRSIIHLESEKSRAYRSPPEFYRPERHYYP